jgi:hypothetical protein
MTPDITSLAWATPATTTTASGATTVYIDTDADTVWDVAYELTLADDGWSYLYLLTGTDGGFDNALHHVRTEQNVPVSPSHYGD